MQLHIDQKITIGILKFMKIILARIRLVVNVLFVVVFCQSVNAWALVGAVNDSCLLYTSPSPRDS